MKQERQDQYDKRQKSHKKDEFNLNRENGLVNQMDEEHTKLQSNMQNNFNKGNVKQDTNGRTTDYKIITNHQS